MSSLEEFYKLLSTDGIDIDAIELAETLWLSQYISKTSTIISANSDGISANMNAKDALPKKEDNHTSADNELLQDSSNVKQSEYQSKKDVSIHPVGDKNSNGSLPFRAPLVRKLYKDNDLIYAFRHFRQKVVSRKRLKLDEDKIADHLVITDIFRPFYKKSYEKRFNVLFLVDISESMKIWESLIEEFIKDVKNYHIFKNASVYYVNTNKKIPEFFKEKEKSSKLKGGWYKYTEPNTLCFMFSDMVSKSWSSGELLSDITLCQQHFPLALIQMLPQRLWNGTKLIDASMGKMSSRRKFSLNSKIQSRAEEILSFEEDVLPELVKIPILNFNESSIDAYGRVINSLLNNKIDGALFERENFQGEYQYSKSDNDMGAEERLRNFYKYASKTSKELLELLAMTPLSFPIIKLIQNKLLPQSTQEHLSELLTSNIIVKNQKVDGFYQFYKSANEENGVRKELIKKIGAKKAFQTIVELSNVLKQHSGVFDFLAYVVDPTVLKESSEFNEIDREFARISVTVLSEMGGKYKDLADRLEKKCIDIEHGNTINDTNSKSLKSIRFVAVGVGGGGGNIIGYMLKEQIPGIELIIANTDAKVLEQGSAATKIQLGAKLTKGLGAGMNPEIGKDSALESYDEIAYALQGADVVFLAVGLGGGTGTGAAPIIAKIAKQVGALTIAVVTKPFSFEGKKRLKLAEDGLNELKNESDCIVVIPNDKLLSIIDPKMGIKESFKIVDSVLARAVSGTSGIILASGDNDINLDFADLQTVMSHRGLALMGVGEYKGENAAYEAIKNALTSPLLDDISIKGALGVLVHFNLHPDFPYMEISSAMDVVHNSVDASTDIIFGTTTDDNLPLDFIRITLIATGFEQKDKVNFEENDNSKILNTDITYECENCGLEHFADCIELDWDEVGGSERSMGAETEYEAEYTETCTQCGNDMSITFTCWEYPTGVENYRDTSVKGIVNLQGNCCLKLNIPDEEPTEDDPYSNVRREDEIKKMDKNWLESIVNKNTSYTSLEEKIDELTTFIDNLTPYAELEFTYDAEDYSNEDDVPEDQFLISREFDQKYLHDLIEEIQEDIDEITGYLHNDRGEDSIRNDLLSKKQYLIESDNIFDSYGVDIECNIYPEDNEQILYIYPINNIQSGIDFMELDDDLSEVESGMMEWFFQNYDDPANFLPYESKEGGYQYLFGGPYELDQILYDEFGDKYPDSNIENVIKNIEQEYGGISWAKRPNDDIYDYGESENMNIFEQIEKEEEIDKTHTVSVPANGIIYKFEVSTKYYVIDFIKRSEDTVSEFPALHKMIKKTNATDQGTINFKINAEGNIPDLNKLILNAHSIYGVEKGISFYSLHDINENIDQLSQKLNNSAIHAQINGNFSGWDGKSVIKLTNGEIWMQTEYYYQYSFAFMPKVTLISTPVGYKMKVDGINKEVGVQKLDNVIESSIRGSFNGWSGNTTVELMNGEKWTQSIYQYSYSYSYNPSVLIYKIDNTFKMKVDGNSETVDVKRIV